MLALVKDPSILKPPGTFNMAKVLQDPLPQNPFSFKEERVMVYACQYNNVCVCKGGRREGALDYGGREKVEGANREGGTSVRKKLFHLSLTSSKTMNLTHCTQC